MLLRCIFIVSTHFQSAFETLGETRFPNIRSHYNILWVNHPNRLANMEAIHRQPFHSSVLQSISSLLKSCGLTHRLSGSRIENSGDSLKSRRYESLEQLPAIRARSLTLPLPAQSKPWLSSRPEQRTADQANSSFFEKLPGEIRTLIYREILCGPVPVAHLVLRQNAPGDMRCAYIRCRAAGKSCGRQRCRDQYNAEMDGDYWGYYNVATRTDGGILPLLLSCRQMSVFILVLAKSEPF